MNRDGEDADEGDRDDADEDSPLGDDERAALLQRVGRRSTVVGTRLPESVTVGDAEFDLREFVARTRAVDSVPPAQREQVRAARSTLAEERKRRARRLAEDDLTVGAAHELADAIVGLDRAVAALSDLESAPFRAEQDERERERDRAWLDLLREVQG